MLVYPSTGTAASGPSRIIQLNANARNGLGPLAIGGNVPVASTSSVTTVSGDMMAVANNRTWNYAVTQPKGAPYVSTIYADPVGGPLVLFSKTTTGTDALPASGGVATGSIGLTWNPSFNVPTDGYHAVSWGSLTNSSYGLVPGAPLLVPSQLTLGQTFVPTPGVSATVTFVGAVPGLSACPNSPTAGATVAYTASFGGITAVELLSFVPGCSITDLVTDGGVEFRLTSVSSANIGTFEVARQTQSAGVIDSFRSLWKAAFTHNKF